MKISWKLANVVYENGVEITG